MTPPFEFKLLSSTNRRITSGTVLGRAVPPSHATLPRSRYRYTLFHNNSCRSNTKVIDPSGKLSRQRTTSFFLAFPLEFHSDEFSWEGGQQREGGCRCSPKYVFVRYETETETWNRLFDEILGLIFVRAEKNRTV